MSGARVEAVVCEGGRVRGVRLAGAWVGAGFLADVDMASARQAARKIVEGRSQFAEFSRIVPPRYPVDFREPVGASDGARGHTP